MSTRTKWMAFLLLLSTWVGIAGWLLMETSEPQRVPRKFTSGQTATQGVARGQVNSALRVDLALLLANRQNVDNSFIAPKNIFRALKTDRETTIQPPAQRREAQRRDPAPVLAPSVPPAAASSPPSPLTMPIPPVASAVPPAPAAPVPPLGPTPEELARLAGRQELSQYRYLGYLVRGGKDEAFLSKGSTLHIVKTGETIDQRVLVKAIAPSGVTLQETASQVEHTLVLAP